MGVAGVSEWSGRKVRRLIDLTLATKGTTCHICGLPGADSADHDPPRSVLIAAGMPDPDDPRYLFPSHRYPCNIRRKARALTLDLRRAMRAARLDYLDALGTPLVDPPPLVDDAPPSSSPRFARRRATL